MLLARSRSVLASSPPEQRTSDDSKACETTDYRAGDPGFTSAVV
jgi:hypothetical protein